MASTQTWQEWNAPGGTYTATGARTEANYKNIDDSTTAYSASPITAPSTATTNYSFNKHQGLVYGGTWNTLSALTYKVQTNAPGTGLTVVASVLAAAPASTAAGAPNSSAVSGFAAASTTGTAANFASATNTSAAIYATGTATATGSGVYYAQVYASQLQVLGGPGNAAPGDITTPVVITATWTES